MLAGIFHESDLLIVEVMNRGIFDNLSVYDLVAVLSTLVYEPRGGDSGGALIEQNPQVLNQGQEFLIEVFHWPMQPFQRPVHHLAHDVGEDRVDVEYLELVH